MFPITGWVDLVGVIITGLGITTICGVVIALVVLVFHDFIFIYKERRVHFFCWLALVCAICVVVATVKYVITEQPTPIVSSNSGPSVTLSDCVVYGGLDPEDLAKKLSEKKNQIIFHEE